MFSKMPLGILVIPGILTLVLAPSRPAEGQANGDSDSGKNLAAEASFEQWVDGRPWKWVLYGDGEAMQTVDARHGHFAVRLHAASRRAVLSLQRSFAFPEGSEGKVLRSSILVKTSARRSASFNIGWDFGKGAQSASRTHPGDGDWTRLVHELEIPSDVNPSLSQVRCIALIRPTANAVAVFDDLTIELVDPVATTPDPIDSGDEN